MVDSDQDTARSAGPAILGYRYQFDRTLLEILHAPDGRRITVEGYEDIDTNDGVAPESIQCKYINSTEYSLTGLRNVILPMLRAFSAGRRRNYRLYAYYANGSKAPERLTLPDLKKSLTETKRKLPQTVLHYSNYSEELLEDFLNFFSITNGQSYQSQRHQVISSMMSAMNCTRQDAIYLHYGNALAYVMDLAVLPNMAERTVTRSEFISEISKRQMLFTSWQTEILGRARILRMMKKQLQSSNALRPRNRRLVILDGSGATQASRAYDIFQVLETLALDHYGVGQLRSARPWSVIIDGTFRDVNAIKTLLIEKGIPFNDGYEGIYFSPQMFNADPIINTKNGGSKISKASYNIRLLGSETYLKYAEQLEIPNLTVNLSRSSVAQSSIRSGQELHLPVTDVGEIMSLIGNAR